MGISLIISVYKKADYLNLVLKSILKQTYKNFEIIVAEDDQDLEIKKLVEKFREENNKIEIKHVSQEDRGFRKNKILNEAIKVSKKENLIFIDGDCILHKNYLKEYSKYINQKSFVYGRRAYLSEKFTKQILNKKKIEKINFFTIFLTKGRKIKYSIYNPFSNIKNIRKGVVGSSMSISRENMIKINGFDEDFEQPYYGEDTDIGRRARLLGLEIISLRHKAIQYHMWHGGRTRKESFEKSKKMYLEKSEENKYICKNGIKKNKEDNG
ncbi:MAG: hypothetical protein B6I28_00710 [Fusobacteriia bacterium 4572_132]|nr:MAG: hypothetical protein B6I28_00710 [Fusobacteriia bacterium 4572_132]